MRGHVNSLLKSATNTQYVLGILTNLHQFLDDKDEQWVGLVQGKLLPCCVIAPIPVP